MQKPPLILDATHITAEAPDNWDPFKDSTQGYSFSGMFGPAGANHKTREIMYNTQIALEQEFGAKSTLLSQSIEAELAATRLEGPTHPLPSAAALVRELGVRNTLIQRKTAELHRQTAITNRFYGSNPLGKKFNDFLNQASAIRRTDRSAGTRELWSQSYRAAHEARLLSQAIQLLNQQQVNVLNWLAAVQAEDQARIAAEQEARRIAAELARINEQAEAFAREQARLAVLAEAQRLATEQALVVAEAAARQVAAEQAQLEALAEAQRQAELLRVETERQEYEKQQAVLAALRVYPALGATASSSTVFSFASTAVILAPETSAAILSTLRSALQVVTAAGAATLGSVLIGFATLLTPSRLGNGERFSMSVPLAELTPESAQSLRAIADRQGTLDLPVGIGYRPIGSGAEVFVITADGFDIRSSVPVRHATFDAQNNVYRLSLPDSPTNTLTWTPAVTPGNSSTERPIVQADTAVYSGAPIVPLEGRLDLHPILVEGWDRFIIVFPDDSGIEPLYVVISSPYQGASVKGKYSGRLFNPELAGGPILDLDWRTAVITQTGIDAVKLHIARLDQSDANDMMMQRLEKILNGYSQLTDTDLRYYTHEMRELERFRALGLSDDFKPDKDLPIWNNAHTATLEDFKLHDDESLLYTKDAITAADRQDEVFFKNFLKGGKQ
ncbi:S-type pyocin domain-containing protein [Pseudomonas mandelii]|uniref:S-type pyocin domain-containing protein n=1 Tax=Pseudomonas mandelii TaxID=75612 RepID=UPI00209F79F9|nr:S-type pyocin domain-containing protein [Pseudomonas mandelii]MCO8314334.1 S-type pyocin domain-containing protein [Pseudomonas mandelii]